MTEEQILANLAARGIPFTHRKFARLRDDDIVRVAELRHRGAFGAGHFALYAPSVEDLIADVARLRSQGARTNDDLVVRLVLAGHDVPAGRLLRAMQTGTRPLLRLIDAAGAAGRLAFADRFAAYLERSPARRRALGIEEPLSRIDEVARDIVDDIADVATVGAVAPTSRIPRIIRHLARVTDADEDVMHSLGAVDLIGEFMAAAARMRAGLVALDDATPADAARAAVVLKDVVALRDALVREGAAGNAKAGLFGRALSIVPFEGAYGLFLGFIISQMIDELAPSRAETAASS